MVQFNRPQQPELPKLPPQYDEIPLPVLLGAFVVTTVVMLPAVVLISSVAYTKQAWERQNRYLALSAVFFWIASLFACAGWLLMAVYVFHVLKQVHS